MIEDDAKKLIDQAVEENVSDIHILPKENQYLIYFRKQGELDYQGAKTIEWGKRLISYLKFLANLDVGEKRKPQSGAIHFNQKDGQLELRLSTMTNVYLLETLVIRLIQQKKTIGYQINTFFPQERAKLQSLVRRKSGLIIFSGPVGSGKTTTIYQLLRERMAQEFIQVITMEDPVEIIEEQFLQTEVNQRAGITYDLLIKASLRHHPDILVIGEIRDEETARMVIRGALTGHLMIATIHAKTALGVIGRLQELNITNTQINQTLIGVISQRLIKTEAKQIQEGRLAMFEILMGDNLQKALNQTPFKLLTINDQLKRAWAYGYISTQSYSKFEIV